MATVAAAIRATLGLDTKPLDAGLAKANASAQGFAAKLKQGLSGLAGLFGARAIVSQVDKLVQGFKDLTEKVELSDDAVRSLKREMSGLSESQAEELAKIPSLFETAGNAASGFFGKLVLGLRAVRSGEGLVGLVRPFEVEKEDQRIGLTNKELADLNKRKGEIEKRQKEEAEKKVESEAKAAEEITAKVLEEQDKQEAARVDSEFRLADVAGKRAILEREITELRAKQKTDDILSREQARTKELEKQRELRDLEVAEILKPREQKRAEAKEQAKIERAERVLDARQRDAADRARRNGRQLAPREGVGELQGPPAPLKSEQPATEGTMKNMYELLRDKIGPKLGVNV